MNVTVYCGASAGRLPEYQQAAIELAKWIVKGQHVLVYGGGNVGLMGVLADNVLNNNGRAIGVMPSFLAERELLHEGLSEVHIASTMPERKSKMIELGDCFIALPGGPGTLEEIVEVISWARIGQNPNPCILYNAGGYYEPLRIFFVTMVKEGFLTQTDFEKLLFVNNITELDQLIANYTPPIVREYMEGKEKDC